VGGRERGGPVKRSSGEGTSVMGGVPSGGSGLSEGRGRRRWVKGRGGRMISVLGR